MEYSEFLRNKIKNANIAGFQLDPENINPMLFEFQKDIVIWSLRLGKSALFMECGLGKTPCQLEWAKHVSEKENKKVLILAPLAVSSQTVREGIKFSVNVKYCRSQEEVESASENIIITNYEMIEHFDADYFCGVVLDESSILKNFTGKTKRLIIDKFKNTKYKLACTATPAPNDHLELGNHADFLNIMPSNEMISRWFINDSMAAGSYRLKKHAAKDFWRWLTSWAVCISIPSDAGYDDDGFKLPKLSITEHVLPASQEKAEQEGVLFLGGSLSATGIWKEKAETAKDRARKAFDIISTNKNDYYIVWCDTNIEADEIKKLLPDAVEVRGSMPIETKKKNLEDFTFGKYKIIITKPGIAGMGLNWQHCRNQIFVGITHSFESFYQSIKRSYRFMVNGDVNIHVINTESSSGIMRTVENKQKEFKKMQKEMNLATKEHGLIRNFDNRKLKVETEEKEMGGDLWKMYLGDCVTRTKEMQDQSVHFSIFSPPFSNLYIYSDSIADMGNSADWNEFFTHFDYLIPEIARVLKNGRLCAVHCKDLPLYMNRDGAAGLLDFPGELIRHFENAKSKDWRFVYHSRVTIWKDPVIEMQRTKNHGLLHRNFTVRGEVARQGMADYLIVFRKWAADMDDKQVQNKPTPPSHGLTEQTINEYGKIKSVMFSGKETEHPGYFGTEPPEKWDDNNDYTIKVWQKYASPVWFDIRQTNVLNISQARHGNDEKHICPLQLDVIKRAIDLWTNEGETVFSPFAGVGSEGYQALKMNRKFIGIELKKEYFEWAVRYLKNEEEKVLNGDLFSGAV